MSNTPAGLPGQPEPPRSPDGRWWWDGVRWIPNAENPDAPPPPVAGETYTPGPPGIPHPYVPPRDVSLPPPVVDAPAPLETSYVRPRPWTVGKLVAVVVGPLLVVVLGIGALFWLSVRSFEQQRARAADDEVVAALTSAAAAMSTYQLDSPGPPPGLTALTEWGYLPDPDVEVVLVDVGEPGGLPTFCLAAGPAGAGPTHWYDPSRGLSETPCGESVEAT